MLFQHIRGVACARRVGFAHRFLVGGLVLFGLTLSGAARGAASASSDEKAKPNPYQASTSRESRDAAVQLIPVEKLTPDARNKVSAVLSSPNIFRRLPVHVTQTKSL